MQCFLHRWNRTLDPLNHLLRHFTPISKLGIEVLARRKLAAALFTAVGFVKWQSAMHWVESRRFFSL
jgi:hypothetical protein